MGRRSILPIERRRRSFEFRSRHRDLSHRTAAAVTWLFGRIGTKSKRRGREGLAIGASIHRSRRSIKVERGLVLFERQR